MDCDRLQFDEQDKELVTALLGARRKNSGYLDDRCRSLSNTISDGDTSAMSSPPSSPLIHSEDTIPHATSFGMYSSMNMNMHVRNTAAPYGGRVSSSYCKNPTKMSVSVSVSPSAYYKAEESAKMSVSVSPPYHYKAEESTKMPASVSPSYHYKVEESTKSSVSVSPTYHYKAEESPKMPVSVSPSYHYKAEESTKMPVSLWSFHHQRVEEPTKMPFSVSPSSYYKAEECASRFVSVSPLPHKRSADEMSVDHQKTYECVTNAKQMAPGVGGMPDGLNPNFWVMRNRLEVCNFVGCRFATGLNKQSVRRHFHPKCNHLHKTGKNMNQLFVTSQLDKAKKHQRLHPEFL